MDNYIIEEVKENHIDKIVDIYNSNKKFLKSHMNISSVTSEFSMSEIKEMKDIGFTSTVVKDSRNNVIGVCEFKVNKEVYLSLLMIDGNIKGKGIGHSIYNTLETTFKIKGANKIRIDVVNEYEGNVIGFWEKQGFILGDEIELQWNKKKLRAVKMYKEI